MKIFRKDLNIREIKSIKSFKYNYIDKSIFHKYIMKNVFEKIEKLVSINISANAITVCGFISIFIGFFLNLSLNPDLKSSTTLLKFLNMLFLLIYFIADGIDGIHARSLNITSPLGHLLDHGVDSFACLLVTVGIISTLNLGFNTLFLLLLLNIFVIFYLTVLEFKLTGIFRFGYISGCSEGIAFVIFLHFLSLFNDFFIEISSNTIFFYLNFLKNNSHWLFIVVLLFNIMEFLYYIYTKDLIKKIDRNFFNSTILMFILFFILCVSFYTIEKQFYQRFWILLIIFSFCFSTCYVEENLSIMVSSNSDKRVFYISLLLLFMFLVNLKIFNSINLLFSMLILISVSFFLLRSFFIIKTICKRLKKPFIKIK